LDTGPQIFLSAVFFLLSKFLIRSFFWRPSLRSRFLAQRSSFFFLIGTQASSCPSEVILAISCVAFRRAFADGSPLVSPLRDPDYTPPSSQGRVRRDLRRVGLDHLRAFLFQIFFSIDYPLWPRVFQDFLGSDDWTVPSSPLKTSLGKPRFRECPEKTLD